MMISRTFVFASVAGLLWAVPGLSKQRITPVSDASANAAESNNAPDNSGVNRRDRKADALTAGQQSSKKADVELTRLVRRDITKHHEFSTNAHNVKIITQNGFVTLKGPVGSQSEMNKIELIARQVAGRQNVKNEMEVTSGE